ncbi:hypothetical protein ACYSNR_15805 [Enterococcus sp. LJL128]|uniref:hypothetical protein n=1 Tax=Enterococcus sp. LJL51 TaxID=3416656 RepID=UPI003CF58D2C
MEILDWLFIGALSAAILFLVLALVYFVLIFVNSSKVKKMKQTKPKKKKKRKRWRRACRMLEKKKSASIRSFVLFFVLASLGGGTAFYARYYQATNLGKEDSEALIQGYYLIANIEEQLNQIPGTDNPKKIQGNIYDLSARLANYGVRTADGRLSAEGQKDLNRLYANMKELGLNLGSQTIETLSDQTTLEAYQADLEKTKTNQKKVFEHFRINEDSLKKNK